MSIRSSEASITMIVYFEVSSESYYTAKLQKPTWPGGMSGVTIGIGYDLGYATIATIQADWGDKLSTHMMEELKHVAGLKGSPASAAAHAMRDVIVPLKAAMAVFKEHDMPKWEGIVSRALPNTDLLSPDCFGALVSLAYNRGASFSNSGDRYREMRNIHDHMQSKNLDAIPDEIRSMSRLWPTVRGLQLRRAAEANLFEKGLSDLEATPVA